MSACINLQRMLVLELVGEQLHSEFERSGEGEIEKAKGCRYIARINFESLFPTPWRAPDRQLVHALSTDGGRAGERTDARAR